MKKFLTSLSLIYATSAMSAGTILDRLGPIPCRTVDIVAGNCDKPGTGSSGTAPSLPAKPINTRHISISMDQHPHTHIATLSALIERDLVEHRLSPAELKNAKEHFVKLIDGINVPAAFLNSHSAMKKGLKADLENLSQGQFASALTGFAEVVKGFGQDKLVEGTSSLIEKVSPRTFEFLVNEQGYTRPEPDAVEFHGLNIDNFRNAIADFEAGNSFTSHSTG
ncbi:MAG TPA: hypothetical protein VE954_09740, partial [Oligoflexus sp.]|uniref:hypothetical protein n=1 Tax=Oligoflexus sp. TaxID=1971216 RepID=UPI002D6298C2